MAGIAAGDVLVAADTLRVADVTDVRVNIPIGAGIGPTKVVPLRGQFVGRV
jgi:hypothetical protein